MAQVTVVIPFYNRKQYLSKAIRSVFDQTYTNWKIILVDDGSTDHYEPEIKPYLKDPRVRLIRNVANVGQSKSLNAALAAVNTPYMVQLDSDDWYFPYTLEVLVGEAESQPQDVAVISGNLNVVWEDSRGNIKREKVKKGRTFSDRYEFLLANTNVVPRFYRTSALRKVGGWPIQDPHQGRYREDMLMLYKLIGRYRFHWVDKPLYNQRVHGTNLTHRPKMLQETAEWSVKDALVRWGDHYKAEFYTTKDGWKKVKCLTVNGKIGRKRNMILEQLEAGKIERLLKGALRNKSGLCIASLANRAAQQELILLRRKSFWNALKNKKVVILSQWGKSSANKIQPKCKEKGIGIVDCIPISDRTTGRELTKKLEKKKFDVILLSSDFNAVHLCRKLLKKLKDDKIIVDLKDSMKRVNIEH